MTTETKTKVKAYITGPYDGKYVVPISGVDFSAYNGSWGGSVDLQLTRAELGALMKSLSADFAALLAKEEKADD